MRAPMHAIRSHDRTSDGSLPSQRDRAIIMPQPFLMHTCNCLPGLFHELERRGLTAHIMHTANTSIWCTSRIARAYIGLFPHVSPRSHGYIDSIAACDDGFVDDIEWHLLHLDPWHLAQDCGPVDDYTRFLVFNYCLGSLFVCCCM